MRSERVLTARFGRVRLATSLTSPTAFLTPCTRRFRRNRSRFLALGLRWLGGDFGRGRRGGEHERIRPGRFDRGKNSRVSFRHLFGVYVAEEFIRGSPRKIPATQTGSFPEVFRRASRSGVPQLEHRRIQQRRSTGKSELGVLSNMAPIPQLGSTNAFYGTRTQSFGLRNPWSPRCCGARSP